MGGEAVPYIKRVKAKLKNGWEFKRYHLTCKFEEEDDLPAKGTVKSSISFPNTPGNNNNNNLYY